MADAESILDYPQLLREVLHCCTEKVTGTLMIATEDNNLARVFFDAGQIVSLAYGGKHGRDVIPLITGIKAGRVRFSAGKAAVGGDQSNLPSTQNILRALGANTSGASPGGASAGAAGRADDLLAIIENAAVDALGPMGGMVFEDAVKTLGDQARAKPNLVLEAVAAEIRDPERARRFRDTVLDATRGR